MPEKSKQILKAYFESGDTPSANEFGDLIDSFLSKVDDEVTGVSKGIEYKILR